MKICLSFSERNRSDFVSVKVKNRTLLVCHFQEGTEMTQLLSVKTEGRTLFVAFRDERSVTSYYSRERKSVCHFQGRNNSDPDYSIVRHGNLLMAEFILRKEFE